MGNASSLEDSNAAMLQICLDFKLDADMAGVLSTYVWTNWGIIAAQVEAAPPAEVPLSLSTPPAKRPRSPTAGTGSCSKLQKLVSGEGPPRMNSASHPTEYKEFLRACANKDSFPVALTTEFTSKKTDLFRQWMNCAKDMDRTATMQLQRKVVKQTEAVTEFTYFKKRELFTNYGGNPDDMECERSKGAMKKTLIIIESCTKAKNFAPDPDLPNDAEEIMYYKRKGASWFHRDQASEEFSGTVAATMDDEMTEALMGERGVLGASLSAAVPLMATEAADSFVAQYMQAEKPTVEQKKRREGSNSTLPAEEALPEEIIDVMRCLMPKISLEAAKAHHYSISLAPHDISDQLVQQMEQHSHWMNAAFKLVQKLVMANVNKDAAYATLRSQIETRMTWFKARSKTCQNMERELVGGSAKKPSAKKAKKASTSEGEESAADV
jgi:hypothetical protein